MRKKRVRTISWLQRLRRFISTATARLALSYLAIIMLMSIGFSLVFYNVSSNQLGRQLPPDSLLHQDKMQDQHDQNQPPAGSKAATEGQQGDHDDIGTFLQSRIDEGRTALKYRLLYVNIGALVVGSVISYFLARRSLRPIERAMEAQAHFINDASHELRTPITAIRTSNDVALRNPRLTLPQAKQLIRQNTEDLERLRELSEGLLTLAQHDRDDVVHEEVDLQEIVGRAMTQVIPQASSKHITVHDEVANTKVVGSKAALEQVIVILLDNAIKYSDEQSEVRLRTRQKGKTVYLDVIDRGIGIRASDIPYLFRRFYRADHSRTSGTRSGYGLGLSIAQRIMASHNSEITVTSKLGQGSTFSIKLTLVGR